jgi:hypothetical protein
MARTTLKQMPVPVPPTARAGMSPPERVKQLEEWAAQIARWAQFQQYALQEHIKKRQL